MDNEITDEQLLDRPDFISELTHLINKHSIENSSNTPDFILARYLQLCLGAWSVSTYDRDKWYGHAQEEAN